jgi:hypothetical protein
MSSVKETFEKRGAAPAVGILTFGILLLFCMLPIVGAYVTEKTFKDLAEAESESGGGGGGHGH